MKIAAVDFDVAIIGQLPAAQFPLDDNLEPGPLEVERFEAALGRRRLIEEVLKNPPRDPHGALVLTQEHAELDGIAVWVPASIFWEREEHHCDLQGVKAMFSNCSIMPAYAGATVEVHGMAAQGGRIAGGFILITGIDGIRYAIRPQSAAVIPGQIGRGISLSLGFGMSAESLGFGIIRMPRLVPRNQR